MNGKAVFRLPRRAFLAAAGICMLLVPLTARRSRAQSREDPIDQPDPATPESFIDRAFDLRRQASASGDQPYGALVVRDGQIVGQSQSLVVINGDPTAHAEMAAIRDAARRTGSRDLSGATLYSSSRPCPMCEAAAYWAGVDRMVFGRTGVDAGRPKLCG